eukprot:scaffold59823_cov79-Phaeocystis_antarctica.AAC.3
MAQIDADQAGLESNANLGRRHLASCESCTGDFGEERTVAGVSSLPNTGSVLTSNSNLDPNPNTKPKPNPNPNPNPVLTITLTPTLTPTLTLTRSSALPCTFTKTTDGMQVKTGHEYSVPNMRSRWFGWGTPITFEHESVNDCIDQAYLSKFQCEKNAAGQVTVSYTLPAAGDLGTSNPCLSPGPNHNHNHNHTLVLLQSLSGGLTLTLTLLEPLSGGLGTCRCVRIGMSSGHEASEAASNLYT